MPPSENLTKPVVRRNTEAASFPDAAACPVCFTDGARRIFFARDRIHRLPGIFAIHRCENCRAYFVQPRLTEDDLAVYYPEDYGRYRVSKSLDKKTYRGRQRFVLEHHYGYPRTNPGHSGSWQRALAFLLSWFTAKGAIPYRGDGKILDIGAASGSHLYRLKQWGWNVYGVEPSAMGASRARSLGLEVHHGTLAEARFPNAFFDVVRLSNVLEHLPDPASAFEEIHRILKPDGLVYITVPNTRSLVFWLFRENWYALDAPRHVISYCPSTLETLCDAAGFEIARMRFAAGPFNFVRSLTYYFEEKGKSWPAWLHRIRWERSKLLRRTLKPFFFFVDTLGYGDFLHATLRKKPAVIIDAAKAFKKSQRKGGAAEASVHLARRYKAYPQGPDRGS